MSEKDSFSHIYKGKLTYSVSILLVLGGLVGWTFGYVDAQFAWLMAGVGLLGWGLRRNQD